MSDPLIGKKLGDYTIQALLGRGGMSRVYRGYDENLDRYAAVKVISGELITTTEEEYTRRFQIEARSIARLRHPNIVGVYQFGRTEGIYYMAQVFLEGRDLRVLLKEYAEKGQRIPIPEALRVARDVASALDYAHEQGVIHRDVKPSNIMLEKHTGRAILMDFGLALSVPEGTLGDTFGSAHYIAPEQAISSANSVPQSDLYSLSIVLYEMLAGKVPFDDPSAMSVALKHLNEAPPPLLMYNPDLPPAAEAVIMRALDKDPNRRYATGGQLMDALEQALGQAPTSAPFTTPLDRVTDSQPAPPARKPLTPEAESSEPAHGVAGRLARRKARKEEEVARQTLGEDALQIDEATLESILDSYADPRDIGLVGPDAKGITLPEKPVSEPSKEGLAGDQKRRSRSGVLLTSVLILVIITVAGWLGLNSNKNNKSAEGSIFSAGDQTRTALVVAAANQTAVTPSALLTETLRPETTTEIPMSPTTHVPTTTDTSLPGATETLTTEPPTPTLTESPTITVIPSSTEIPTEATTPVESPTGVENRPNIRLLYDNGEFLLVNISGQALDISQLTFEQELPDGTVRTFEAQTWNQVSVVVSNMPSNGCYQLVTSEADRITPTRDQCQRFLGWFRSNSDERYFWVSGRPEAEFTVRGADGAVLATCAIQAGECRFYMPSP
jgi:serine/threonine protein kinase/cytoskeletal protein RodZ